MAEETDFPGLIVIEQELESISDYYSPAQRTLFFFTKVY